MKKLISLCLAVALCLSLAPAGLAARLITGEETPETAAPTADREPGRQSATPQVSDQEAAELAAVDGDRGFVMLDKESSTIAPGITQEIATVRKKYNDQRLVYYTMTVDTRNEYAHIYANYKDNEWEPHSQGIYGFQEVTDQMDAAQRNHTSDPDSPRYVENYTVVGGVNGTGFDMSTGQTRGILVMEGHEAQGDTNKEPFFAIDTEGKPHIYWNQGGTDYETHKGEIAEAINSFVTPLIRNRVIVASKTANEPNARTALGITEDDKVILLVTDGKQKPTSEGCDMYELAEILLDMGCVDAFNMDGGGSTTFVSRPEGEDTYRVINKPCDGSPRSVSASLLVVSTAPNTEEFARASLSAEDDYITPGGSTELTAIGLNPAEAAFPIPENAQWSVDAACGTVTQGTTKDDNMTQQATFTAAEGFTGEATISLTVDGETVGETTVNVVKPNVFRFGSTSYTLPYGRSMDLDFQVAYAQGDEERAVTTHPGDIQISVIEGGDIATVDGLRLTSKTQGEADAATVTGKLSATLVCAGLTVQADLTVGRGTETIQDFEFDDPSEFAVFDGIDRNKQPSKYVVSQSRDQYNNIQLQAELVTAEEGHVHSGKYAVRITLDARNLLINPCGAGAMQPDFGIKVKETPDATDIGAWIWVPDEEVNNSLGPFSKYPYPQGTGVNYDEGHWVYINELKEPQTLGWVKIFPYLWCNNNNPDIYKKLANKLVFYVDDIQADYSAVRPDREMPIMGEIQQPLPGDGNKTLERGKVFEYEGTNTVEFVTTVSDPEDLNTTGIDPDNIKAYIDGMEIGTTYNAGKVNTVPTQLPDGVHTLKLYVPDGAGNTTSATRQFRVSSGSELPTVNVSYRVPGAEAGTGRVLINSVSYLDVTPTDLEKTQKVELKLDLLNNALWQLDYAEVDPKFSMEYTLDKYENIARVTLTRTDDWAEGDKDLIASLPLRTWGYDWPMKYDLWNGSEWTKPTVTPTEAWTSRGNVPCIQMCIDVDRGVLTYMNGDSEATTVFGAENIRKDTELYGPFATVKAENPGKNSWHLHDEKLTNMEDKAATCTTDGYKGRTFCETCQSVVEWGEIEKALGHHYAVDEEGYLSCEQCHRHFEGVYDGDGKTYVDGLALDGWQEDGSYYDDGVKRLGGIYQAKDAGGQTRWHHFDEEGQCTDRETGYTGYYTADENGVFQPVKTLPTTQETLKAQDYYYAEVGLPKSDWVTGPTDDLTQPSYHIGEDGKVHWVEVEDTRECVKSGYLNYTCTVCKDPKDETKPLGKQSELLWFNGHDWDEDHVCRKCQYPGRDISKAVLNLPGENFTYTSHPIRAAHIVSDNGRWLSVRSDANGLDGYSRYANNTEIGVATLTIEGRGNYYGELVGHFNIVPASVEKIQAKEQGRGEAGQWASDLTFTWDRALGAQYYELYRWNDATRHWDSVAKIDDPETSYTVSGLKLGESYRFKMASRTVVDGQTFYCTTWSNEIQGTVEHIWQEDTEKSRAATCTQAGLQVRDCLLDGCGAHEENVLPALGHTWVQDASSYPANCGADGKDVQKCTVCGETTETILPATGQHTWVQDASSYPANCGVDGKDVQRCSICGETTETILPATGQHQVEEWTVTVKPTQETGGLRQGNCIVCGQLQEQTLSKLPAGTTHGSHGSSGSSASSGTVGTGSAGATTGAGKFPDGTTTGTNTTTDTGSDTGSTTTETTKAPDGTVTETVKQADGTTTETVTETDGTVTTTVESPDGAVTETVTETDGTVTTTVESPDGTVTETVQTADGAKSVEVTGKDGQVLAQVELPAQVPAPEKAFDDVPEDHWAKEAVDRMAGLGLVQGMSPDTFDTNGTMTRGAVATVLFRLSNGKTGMDSAFADVSDGAWYADGVAWAATAGVVTGYGNGVFGPGETVSRQQFAVMLCRYAQLLGMDTSATTQVSSFQDGGQVADWAGSAMAWAVERGIVQGTGNNALDPNGTATRAQCVVMLSRFIDLI